MNDLDLERLAQMWQQPPPQAELDWMEESAMRGRRRGRAAMWLDAGLAMAVAALMIFLVWLNPRTGTAVAATAGIALLLLTQRRQRRLRAVELQGLTGSTEDMLDQSIARTRAALKRNRFSLVGIGPATLLGWLFAYYVEAPGSRILLRAQMGDGWFRGAFFLLLLLMVMYLLHSIRSGRAELERLEVLRVSYRREKEESQSGQQD